MRVEASLGSVVGSVEEFLSLPPPSAVPEAERRQGIGRAGCVGLPAGGEKVQFGRPSIESCVSNAMIKARKKAGRIG